MLGLLLFLLAHSWGESKLTPVHQGSDKRIFKVTFYCSDKKCCGRYSPQRGGSGNTTRGNTPIAWRTAASGDPDLHGKWILLQDLGGPVFVSDTGATCDRNKKTGGEVGRKRRGQAPGVLRLGCVASNQLDIFVGGPEHHKDALRMGVQWWEGVVR